MITGLLLSMVLSGPAMAQGLVSRMRVRERCSSPDNTSTRRVAIETRSSPSSRPTDSVDAQAVLGSLAYCHENLGETERALDVLYRYRGLAEEGKDPGDRAAHSAA